MFFFGFRNGGIDRALQVLQGGLSSNGKLLRAHDWLEVLLVLKDRLEAEPLYSGPNGNGTHFPLVPFRRGLPLLR